MNEPRMRAVNDDLKPAGLRTIWNNSVRFWEPRRAIYNLILTLVVILWVGSTWPHFKAALVPQSLLLLVILAIMANACYCAAYAADLLIQFLASRTAWRHLRWGLWATGMVLAVAAANYWIADEVYPFVR
jgi:hypothetical protein